MYRLFDEDKVAKNDALRITDLLRTQHLRYRSLKATYVMLQCVLPFFPKADQLYFRFASQQPCYNNILAWRFLMLSLFYSPIAKLKHIRVII